MSLVLNDRVQQTGTANTTVSFTLSATTTAYQSFAVVGNGNTTYYAATDGTNWEVGLGTYSTTGPTLTRTTILSSSNSNTAVTFSGSVTVWCDYPASKAVIQDSSNNVTGYAISGGTIDNTVIGATTPAAGTFNTLIGGKSSTTYVTITGDASYPMIQATGGTNTPLVLSPLGTGALQAQKTDSTATGGNVRGANAVDWQTSRASATQVASGSYSVVAGGSRNTASGVNTTITGGDNSSSNSTGAFIGGGYLHAITNTSQTYSAIVGGYNNSANGVLNFVGGGQLNSATVAAAVTTQAVASSGVTSGSTAVTLAASNASIKVGQLITGTGMVTFTYVAAISGTSLTLSQNANASGTPTLSFYTPHGVVVGGGNNQATGAYSFIGGGGDAGTSSNRNVASGDWSFVGGGTKNIASGFQSLVVGGNNATASGTNSAILMGATSSVASGSYSTLLNGTYNNSSGTYSTVINGSGAIARGITGYTVFGGIFGSTVGDTQAALLVIKANTSDATATALTVNNAAAGTTNQVILPNNSAYYFKVSVIAGVTGAGNTKAWTLEGAIKRGAGVGTTAIVGTVTTTIVAADVGAATWTVTATADTTNGGLAITVTGQAATTIRWVAKSETAEMTY